MSDLEIFDGESYRGVSRKKLLALVRKLREQRDAVFEDLWRERGDGWLGEHHEQSIEKANAALDEIVRGG